MSAAAAAEDDDAVVVADKKRAAPSANADVDSDSDSDSATAEYEWDDQPPEKRARGGKAEAEADDSDGPAGSPPPTPSPDVGFPPPLFTIEEQMLSVVKHLKKHGWAVVRDVFTPEECEAQRSRMWEWHEKTTQGRVDRNKPETWASKTWVPHTHRIVQHYAVGHSEAAWKARTNAKVVEVFARLHGTDKLTCSFDGMNLWPAPEQIKGSPWPQNNVWTHVDQNPKKKGLRCVQAFATFEEIDGPNDATLQVIDKGHKDHSKMVRKHGVVVKDNSDWKKFTPEELEKVWGKKWISKKTVRISAPPGAVILWDSRAPHQAVPAKKGRPIPRHRFIVYLCYGPTRHMTMQQANKKRAAATNYRTTTHWPLQSKLFAPNPQTYGRVLPEYDVQKDGRDDTDPAVRKLCCFDDYGSGTTGLLGWTPAEHKPMMKFLV